MNKGPREYFKGLNGIRAVAAVGVMISHSLQEMHNFGFKRMSALQFGGIGVTIFFTLSGFLITYLLLKEIENYKTIDIRKFYLRRVLRIWPLYFFYILLVFVCSRYLFLGPLDNWKYIYLYVLFFSNLAFNFNVYPNFMGHLWSIAIEEQFYAFWPFVLKYKRNLKAFLLLLIVLLVAAKIIIKFYSQHIHNSIPFSIISCMRFDNMAIGALFAIGFYNKNQLLLRISKSKLVDPAFWLIVLLALFNRFSFFSIFNDDIASLVTGLFIISQITNVRKTTAMENPIMIFLGQISYGIYVYHILIIGLLGLLVKRYNLYGYLINPVFVVITVISTTILISFLSYQYLEMPFLKLKNKFALVKSGRLKV